MKILLIKSVSLALAVGLANAQIGGSGRDGAFTPTTNTTLNTAANQGRFEFTTMRIPTGVQVTVSGPNPAVILVQGAVNIAGQMIADGSVATAGPGGFPGGAGGPVRGNGLAGQGPGGGGGGQFFISPQLGGSGGHATPGMMVPSGGSAGLTYGSVFPFDLRGGSGGGGTGGSQTAPGSSGSGGGGTIVILSDATIDVSGTISARGGTTFFAAPGSGGSVLLRSMRGVNIAGSIDARGGQSAASLVGGDGFTRVDVHGGTPVITGTMRPAPSAQELPFVRSVNVPRLSQSWNIDAYTVPGGGVAWFLGLAPASLPFPPLGTLRLDPAAGLFLLGTTVTQVTPVEASSRLTLSIPADPFLVGLQLYVQGLDLGAALVRPLLTNSVSGTISL